MKGVPALSSASSEPLEIVLKNYPVGVLETRNESYKDKKGVWWVKTQEGMYILKKISNSEDTLKFILDAVRHLSSNGVNLPAVIKTRDGKDYVNHQDVCYVLTQAVEGRNPSYSSPDELKQVVSGLAQFHKSSAGFFPAQGTKPKYHLGLWVEDYSEQIEDINNFYKKELLNKSTNKAGAVIIKEFPYFYERAQTAISGLRGRQYADWVKKAGMSGSLCHQDFAAGNLIITKTNSLYVLDTDSITVDIPARDIRKLLNKVMKKMGKWDRNLTRSILAWYQRVNPLTAPEWQVVRLDLTFPHLFIGAANKYYYQRDKEWTEEKYLQRIVEMAGFEKSAQPLLDDFNSIAPV